MEIFFHASFFECNFKFAEFILSGMHLISITLTFKESVWMITSVNPEIMKFVMDEMALEVWVELLYHTTFIKAIVSTDTLELFSYITSLDRALTSIIFADAMGDAPPIEVLHNMLFSVELEHDTKINNIQPQRGRI